MERIETLMVRQGIHALGAYILYDITSIPIAAVDALLPLLPAWRRDEALAFRREEGRREDVLSYLLLTHILRVEHGITSPVSFVYGTHGKPLLRDYPAIHFNISHCRSAVAVAVDTSPVGIDIERRGRYKARVARHLLTADEYATLLVSADRDLAFTTLWTRKEATVKLTGASIYTDMASTISACPEIVLRSFVQEGFVCSVARYKEAAGAAIV